MAFFGLAEIGAAAIVALFTSRISQKIGHQKMVGVSMAGTALAALILATANQLPITLIAGAISGASWTAATIGLFGLFIDSTHDVPNTEMTRYSTVYHQLIFVAAFIGPMIGSNLANTGMALPLVMLLGVTLRILASSMVMNIDQAWATLALKSRVKWAVRHR